MTAREKAVLKVRKEYGKKMIIQAIKLSIVATVLILSILAFCLI